MKKNENAQDISSDEFLYSIWNFFSANLSEKTRKNYFNIIKSYIKLTGNTPDNLTHSDSDKYFNELVTKMNAGKLSKTTAIMRLSVMKSLCDYIKHKKNMSGEEYTNFFREYTIPSPDKDILNESLPSEEEIDYLFNTALHEKDDTFFCILALVVKCGLTISELCRITTGSVLYDKNENICLSINESKKVSRIIKLPADVNKIMKKYLKKHVNISDGENNEDADIYIFHNKRGTNLKPRDAERLLKQYITVGTDDKMIKKSFTFQDLRHAAIKYMLIGNVSDDEVAAYCGITTKWLPRYRRIVSDSYVIKSADYSVISINTRS